MPVTVRNLSRTNVVLSSPDKGTTSIDWLPAGDPSGEDVQLVPDSVIQSNTQFLKSVGLGILAIETDDEALKASIAKQAQRYQRNQESAKTEVEAVLDRTSASGVIVITEDQIDRHIEALSKSQSSDLSTIGEPS